MNFLKTLENQYLTLAITLVIAGTIFYMSSLSFPPSLKIGIDLSSAYHFVIFFLFSFFLLLAIKGKNRIKLKYLIISLIISVLYAASDEIHQFFVPYRSCTLADFLTDSSGILTAIVLLSFILSREYSRKAKSLFQR